jgi:hypothetical protein
MAELVVVNKYAAPIAAVAPIAASTIGQALLSVHSKWESWRWLLGGASTNANEQAPSVTATKMAHIASSPFGLLSVGILRLYAVMSRLANQNQVAGARNILAADERLWEAPPPTNEPVANCRASSFL